MCYTGLYKNRQVWKGSGMAIKKKRLNLDIPTEIHQELKFLSVVYNTTITKLVIREIIKLIAKHKVSK